MKHLLKATAPLLLCATLPATAASIYTEGHGDIGVGLEGGALHLHLHLKGSAVVDGTALGGTGAEFEPGDIAIAVPTSSILSADFPALGAMLGDTAWILGVDEVPGVPYLGFSTDELVAADWAGNITFTLSNVTSPSGSGHFAVWQPDGVGGIDILMSTAVSGATGLSLMPEVHGHSFIGFTAPGEWLIEITASGTHNTLGNLSSTETFVFQVVPEPSAALLVGLGGIGAALRRRRR